MGAVTRTPGETLGTLYNIHVGSNKTKQHASSLSATGPPRAAGPGPAGAGARYASVPLKDS